MTPVKVHIPLPASTAMDDVKKLLSAAGLMALSDINWIADCAEGDGPPVLIVFVSSDPAVAEGLEPAVRQMASQGGRVIGVWPAGGGFDVLPAALEDYGAGSSNWNAEALRKAICAQGSDWQDSSGGTRDQRALDRNKNC
jgi:hypothetical protein